MRRPANQDKVLDRIKKWRGDLPDLTLRSSFIVGFPGETEDDFETLLDFMKKPKSIAPAASNTKTSPAPRPPRLPATCRKR